MKGKNRTKKNKEKKMSLKCKSLARKKDMDGWLDILLLLFYYLGRLLERNWSSLYSSGYNPFMKVAKLFSPSFVSTSCSIPRKTCNMAVTQAEIFGFFRLYIIIQFVWWFLLFFFFKVCRFYGERISCFTSCCKVPCFFLKYEKGSAMIRYNILWIEKKRWPDGYFWSIGTPYRLFTWQWSRGKFSISFFLLVMMKVLCRNLLCYLYIMIFGGDWKTNVKLDIIDGIGLYFGLTIFPYYNINDGSTKIHLFTLEPLLIINIFKKRWLVMSAEHWTYNFYWLLTTSDVTTVTK